MYTFIIVLICIAAVLLVLVVLAQNPKSGMAANFASSNQVMGVRQTADFLEKFTWGLAIAIVALSLLASVAVPSKSDVSTTVPTETLQFNDDMQAPSQTYQLPTGGETPSLPTQQPETTSEPTNN